MKILVCISHVPDTTSKINFVNGDTEFDTNGVQYVINPNDEFGLTRAIWFQEQQGAQVTVVNVGGTDSEATLRKALAIGANEAIRINATPTDGFYVAKQLAEVVKSGGYDLVICGTESTDARMSVVPAMISARLGWAQLTFASKVTVDPAGSVAITRVTEAGVDEISAAFPCVVSVVEKINEPRYPSFKGIMAAKKKTIEQKDLAAVGASAQSAWSQVSDATPRPPRAAGVKVNDEGNGGEALVNFLAEKKLI